LTSSTAKPPDSLPSSSHETAAGQVHNRRKEFVRRRWPTRVSAAGVLIVATVFAIEQGIPLVLPGHARDHQSASRRTCSRSGADGTVTAGGV
jgi:hypothetical protein